VRRQSFFLFFFVTLTKFDGVGNKTNRRHFYGDFDDVCSVLGEDKFLAVGNRFEKKSLLGGATISAPTPEKIFKI